MAVFASQLKDARLVGAKLLGDLAQEHLQNKLG